MKRIFFALFIVLVCAAAFANNLPRIAVYVTGEVPDNEKRALGTRMLASLINSGRYRAIERSNAFLAEIEREQERQRSGAIDDSQISALGRQFGIEYICIADITPAFGSFQVSARIVDVETAEVISIGDSHSPLSSMDDLTKVASEVVRALFGGEQKITRTEPAPTPAPTPMHAPSPTIAAAPPPAPTPAVTGTVIQGDNGSRGSSAEHDASFMAGLSERRHDHYFSIKYHPPITGETRNGWTTNLEYGQIRGEGWFWGLDFSLGFGGEYCDFYSSSSYYNCGTGYNESFTVGGGVSFGNTYGEANGWQFAVGGTAGVWGTWWERITERWDGTHVMEKEFLSQRSFGGPFVKVRWRFLEMSYRGLIGYGWGDVRRRRWESSTSGGYWTHDRGDDGYDSRGIGWISQLMVGYHFQTTKRVRRQ